MSGACTKDHGSRDFIEIGYDAHAAVNPCFMRGCEAFFGELKDHVLIFPLLSPHPAFLPFALENLFYNFQSSRYGISL
jgi:hypothetical protein